MNYDKWNKLDDYSSDDDTPSARPAPSFTMKSPHKEEIRWGLTRHGIPFTEHSYPWGLHLWATLGHSDPMPHAQQVAVPVLETDKKDCYKRSPTDIFMFMFASAFSTPIRIYSTPIALELQQKFDKVLGPAVIRVFLDTVLTDPKLEEKYILSTVHLNTWAALQRVCWPLLKIAMKRHYKINPNSVEDAWATVERIFGEIDQRLEKDSNIKYLAGTTNITAADISFASHAALVLFPNEVDDTFASALGLKLPSYSELPLKVAERARKLRETKAGKFAIRMYRKERASKDNPSGCRSFPSKYTKENNPWWSQEGGYRLQMAVMTGLVVLTLVMNIFIMFLPLWASLVAIGVIIGVALWGYRKYIRNSLLETRIKQIWFTLFGTPVPTERDKLEAAEEEKTKADKGAPSGKNDKPSNSQQRPSLKSRRSEKSIEVAQ
ncbi:hypothetical protein HDV05_002362 [Chytridiales sp. JEL 0842]|nr:hypothetical protein HDV05_002362 [Chytridiales sp. JEL 0842]